MNAARRRQQSQDLVDNGAEVHARREVGVPDDVLAGDVPASHVRGELLVDARVVAEVVEQAGEQDAICVGGRKRAECALGDHLLPVMAAAWSLVFERPLAALDDGAEYPVALGRVGADGELHEAEVPFGKVGRPRRDEGEHGAHEAPDARVAEHGQLFPEAHLLLVHV